MLRRQKLHAHSNIKIIYLINLWLFLSSLETSTYYDCDLKQMSWAWMEMEILNMNYCLYHFCYSCSISTQLKKIVDITQRILYITDIFCQAHEPGYWLLCTWLKIFENGKILIIWKPHKIFRSRSGWSGYVRAGDGRKLVNEYRECGDQQSELFCSAADSLVFWVAV